MKPFEQAGMMQEPVHPVKISIMHKHHERKGKDEIYPSMVGYIKIICSMRSYAVAVQHYQWRHRKNDNGQSGKEDLTTVLLPFGKPLLDLFISDLPFQEDIKKQECRPGNKEIFVGHTY
jgi:hypothetical protein